VTLVAVVVSVDLGMRAAERARREELGIGHGDGPRRDDGA
jgi:hypothetical protein